MRVLNLWRREVQVDVGADDLLGSILTPLMEGVSPSLRNYLCLSYVNSDTDQLGVIAPEQLSTVTIAELLANRPAAALLTRFRLKVGLWFQCACDQEIKLYIDGVTTFGDVERMFLNAWRKRARPDVVGEVQSIDFNAAYKVDRNDPFLMAWALNDLTMNKGVVVKVVRTPPEPSDVQPPAKRAKKKGEFIIYLKDLVGKTHSIAVKKDLLVEDLKHRISGVCDGLEPAHQRIMYAGRQLAEGLTLAYYDIKNESTLHLVLRITGC